MNNDKKIQDMILENEQLKKHIQTLYFQIRSLERGCACYMNNCKNTENHVQKKEE